MEVDPVVGNSQDAEEWKSSKKMLTSSLKSLENQDVDKLIRAKKNKKDVDKLI